MALQSSGAISMNDLHVEAGGSSGTTVSISDSDVRNLISKGSGATASVSEWYGASAMSTITSTGNYFQNQNLPYSYYAVQFHNHISGGAVNTNGQLIQSTAANATSQTPLGPESNSQPWDQLVGGLSYSRNWANVRFAQISFGNPGQSYYLNATNSSFKRTGDYCELIYNGTLMVTLNQKYEEPSGGHYNLTFYNSSVTNTSLFYSNNVFRNNPALWQLKYYY